ncbi:MAG: tetratricopeptide repeat protein, partial [Myxococcota bacterium]|nr:tetratricopeptide repeat protein [Myxococcota bacterium]
ADRHLAEAAAAGPSPVAWLQFGFAMLDLGKWAVAEEAFERVLSADPDSSQARVGLGAASAGRGDLERAENMLAEAAQAGRVSPAAILLLATVQADRGRTEAARATAMRLLDESGDSAPSVRLAARTLLDDLRRPAAR